MIDNFREEVAVKRNKGVQNLLYGLCWLIMIGCGGVAFINFATLSSSGSMNELIIRIAIIVVFAGLVYLLWRSKDNFRTEYEYCFTNGDLDVSMVLGNSRRKYLTSLPMRNVESCGLARMDSNAFNRQLNTPNIKKHNWYLNREAQLVYFAFTKNNIKHLMVVELSDEMIAMIRSQNYLGFGVWQD